MTGRFFLEQRELTSEPANSGTENAGILHRSVPWRALAATVALAIAAPALVIQLSVSEPLQPGIDPITTAGIPAERTDTRFRIEDVELTRFIKNGDQVVTIRGKVANQSGDSTVWPELQIQLYDGDNLPVQTWRHRPGTGSLNAGQDFHFYTSAIDATGRGEKVSVSVGR